MKVRGLLVVATLVLAQLAGLPAAFGQRVGNPSGPFQLTVHTATLQIRAEVFDFSDARQPQCSNGSNDDTDLMGGAPQDNNIDFPADGQCTSAADDSEVQGGFQPLSPVRLTGTIAGDGNWTVATSGVQVPQVWLFARPPILGGTVITVTTSATHTSTGNLNPLTGAASLRLRLRIDIDGTGLGGDCHIGDSGNPIDINTLSTGNSPGGAPYNADTGALGMANHTFAVPGASGCSTFPINVNNEINSSLGLPSPSGQNHGIFNGDFPPSAKPLRAITAQLSAAATVACRPVNFSAAGSTSVLPVTSYAFDDTNDGTFEQTGLLTTRSVTFNTAGTRTARLRVSDTQGDFHERLRTYTVGTNLAPSAPNQNKPRSGSGDPVPVTLTGSDPEGGPVTFGVASGPANGTLSGAPPNLTYTPNAGFGGADSFTYSVTDDCANTRTGTVVLNVNGVPTATPQTVSTNQEQAVNVTLAAVDGDGDALSFAVASLPSNGTLSGTAPNLTYSPNAGFFGSDTFTFTASDAFDTSVPGTVTVNVAQNNPPTADPQSVTTAEDTPVGVTLTGSDSDGDPLSFTTTDPPNGVLSGVAPALSYSPNADFTGTDSFDFTVDDGKGGTDTATVSITVTPVNDPPVADDQTVNTQQEQPVSFTADATDVDGDSLTYTELSPPANGVLTGSFPNFTYTPVSGFIGTDTLVYSVADGNGGSDTATVTFVVIERNDPPTATDQNVSTNEDTAAPITLAGTDPEGAPLTIAVTSNPNNGTLSGVAPNLVYTPNADFNGFDSFTFEVSDGVGTDEGTVTIAVLAVNDPPVANPQTVGTAEDTPVGIVLTASDVDNPSGDLQIQLVSQPANGVVSGSGASVTYTPAANFNGTDSFTFRARDPFGAEDVATVTVVVSPANDAPVATDRTASTLEDTTAAITVSGSDLDGDALAFAVVSHPAHGTLSGAAPNLTYTPALNYNGFDSFTFSVDDGQGGTDTGTVTIAVLAVNDAPTANPGAVSTAEDTPVGITLTGSDPDGDALTFAVEVGPAHGTLSGTAPNLTYTPAADYAGPDSLTFSVRDPSGATNTAAVSISVSAVPKIGTTLAADPAVAQIQGTKFFYPRLSATLTRNDTSGPLPGRVVAMFVADKFVCQAVTDAGGRATCAGTSNRAVVAQSYEARFAGDADFAPSSGTGRIVH